MATKLAAFQIPGRPFNKLRLIYQGTSVVPGIGWNGLWVGVGTRVLWVGAQSAIQWYILLPLPLPSSTSSGFCSLLLTFLRRVLYSAGRTILGIPMPGGNVHYYPGL
jgi:hypothetical protein